MTLTLASVPTLEAEANRILKTLRGRQLTVTKTDLDANGGSDAVFDALLRGAVDLVLVQGADVRTLPEGTLVIAVLSRADARDVLVSLEDTTATLLGLPAGARVGVSGARRKSFLRAHRPDVLAVPPGNGGGPVRALEARSVDAIVLGAAEARRLGLIGNVSEILDPNAWMPGAGQGATVLLGKRGQDVPTEIADSFDDPVSHAGLRAELSVLEALGATAESPVGVTGLPHGRWIRVRGMVASLDGRRIVRGDITGPIETPDAAGRALAELLLARGAGSLLRGDPV